MSRARFCGSVSFGRLLVPGWARLRVLGVWLVMGSALALAQQADPAVGGAAMSATKTIVENAASSPVHRTLVAAVKAAGLVDALSGAGPFTVFAPTDAAFAKLPAGALQVLAKPDNKALLRQVLMYHVVAGRYDVKALLQAIRDGHGEARLKTVEGDELILRERLGRIVVSDGRGDQALITTADVYQANGVIQVIDTLLQPAGPGGVGWMTAMMRDYAAYADRYSAMNQNSASMSQRSEQSYQSSIRGGMRRTSPDVAAKLAPSDWTPIYAWKDRCVKVRVFYATDRRETEQAGRVGYGPEEGDDRKMSYGSVMVSLPPGHKRGDIEEPSMFKLQIREDPQKHVVIDTVTLEDKDQFFTNLQAAVASNEQHQALVFVHGFNVTFDDAAKRVAQLSYDLRFSGAPILYSWPSRGSASPVAYKADGETVQWTKKHLVEFLQDVHERSGATVVHVIAHSMGNLALLYALEDLAQYRPEVHFGQMVLAAPDVPQSYFLQQIPVVERVADHITLYASSKDEALAASRKFNDYPRAGQSAGHLTIIPPVETIDASAVTSGFLGHSYFGESSLVLDDMTYLIQRSLPASQRPHLQVSGLSTGIYWTFVPGNP